jgi:hypothetical protein
VVRVRGAGRVGKERRLELVCPLKGKGGAGWRLGRREFPMVY